MPYKGAIVAKDKWTGPPEIDPNTRLCTPAAVLDPLRACFGRVTFDPCGDPHSIVDAETTVMHPLHGPEIAETLGYFGDELAIVGLPGIIFADGLDIAWPMPGFKFVNPPYSRTANAPWAAKCSSAGMLANHLVALVPCSPDTEWFGHYWTARRMCFLDHRVKHLGGAHGAGTFASVLCYWGVEPNHFADAVKCLGRVITP